MASGASGPQYMQPPSGGSHSTGPGMLVITWLFTGISAVVVSLKIWTRYKIIGQTGLEDVFTVLALAFLLAFAPIITLSVHKGLGQRVYYLTPAARTASVKVAIISNPLIFLASAWPNISVAISINRILVPQPWQLRILYGIPILQCTVALICSIITYTMCLPLEGLWNPTVPHTCLPQDVILGILYFNGAMSAFTHVFLAVVPIFGLWNIKMKTRTKVGIMLLTSTTGIAAIAAVIRTVNIPEPGGPSFDFSYTAHKVINWAIIEAAFIIIAACIPSLRPFVKALGRSLHLDQAKSLLIPKGYHHSHSRRHRPPPLVPRDSGSGATAGTATRNRSGPDEDVESGTAMQQEKRQEFAEATTPSTAKTDKSMEKEAEEAMSHV